MTLVIFDLDDTLIDLQLYDYDSFEFVRKKFHLQKFSKKIIFTWRKNGMLSQNILKRIIGNDKKLLNTCIKARIDYLDSGGGGISLIKPKPFVFETLQSIFDQDHRITVVSARKNKKIIQNIMKELGLKKFISKIYCAQDYQKNNNTEINNVELKNQLYKLLLSDFQHEHHKKVILIANLKTDFIPAKKLKILGYGLKGSYRLDGGLSKLVPILDDVRDVLQLL